MSTVWFIIINPRPSPDDVQFSNIIAVKDPEQKELDTMQQTASSIGCEVRGPFNSELDARNEFDKWRLESYKEYAKDIEAALIRGTLRMFLVYLDNKLNSDLLVYPGYYATQQKCLDTLNKLFHVRIITGNDDLQSITVVDQVIVIRDLDPVRGERHGCWFVKWDPILDLNPHGTNKKLFEYFLNWENICKRAVRLAIVKKFPGLPPIEDTIDKLTQHADHAGFGDCIARQLVQLYHDNLIDDIDAPFEMYIYNPNPPTASNRKTGKTVTLDFDISKK